MLGICNGFQALIKLGLVPYGRITQIQENDPTLTFNTLGRHVSRMVYTRVTSVKSPWLMGAEAGQIHTVPVSHGEGRFVADAQTVARLMANGQIATQYVDLDGNPSMDIQWNPNGSVCAIEGITSRMAGFWARWATLSGREKTCTVMCLAKRTSSCSRPA